MLICIKDLTILPEEKKNSVLALVLNWIVANSEDESLTATIPSFFAKGRDEKMENTF